MLRKKHSDINEEATPPDHGDRRVRADAQRNMDALLEAAKAVFISSGVDAPVREIAEKAGVGVGTLYRHFPNRSDLVAAIFRREVDACAAASTCLGRQFEPDVALGCWLHRYTEFIATKRGLAAALHSGDPAFASLHEYFRENLEPALKARLDAAIQAGQVRADITPFDLLLAVGKLCITIYQEDANHIRQMVDLLMDGMRYGAKRTANE